MDRQCSSCGGFCRKSGCERENVKPEQEPVAVFRREILGRGQIFWLRSSDELPNETPLYTTPPQREWQGLTDDEMLMIYAQPHEGFKYSLGRMVQAKLKEKNNG